MAHSKVKAWFLFEAENPNNVFYFQFNPSEMTIEHESEWDDVDASGVSVQTLSFKQRKPKEYKFDLFLNDWGRHATVNDSPLKLTVEQQIGWLDRRMYPTSGLGAKDNQQYSPPVLIFAWRQFEPVVITSMSVKRTHFRPADHPFVGNPIINPAETPQRFIGPSARAFDTRDLTPSNFQRTALKAKDGSLANDVTFQDSVLYRPGDAIRATVSITLREYRPSTSGDGIDFTNLGTFTKSGATYAINLVEQGLEWLGLTSGE